MLDASIPLKLQEIVQRELDCDERVVWSEMPKPKYFSGPALGMFLFAIPWTAFSVFWMAGAAGFKIPQFNNGEDLFPLFGIPFFLIGIGMLSSPLWAYRNSLRTVYLITDRRAITIDGGMSYTIRSYTPEKLNDTFRREHKDGTGDVIIFRNSWRDSDGDKQMQELGFLRIDDAKSIELMLKQLAEPANARERRS
ncbi:hypothetical protein Enr13x_09110 [Stieleria neptunia]|uniref:DUF304 domain-containing protein n=1 Tax=Stieleria neptunia TaxID=2527979 RepID=A0A518HJR3_9BACT|nr:hypothetical protein [Stieleria neptunia]QDV41073.1 hypothetical protein Enr13x_09110 [Stieleria neptunia]